MELYACGFNAWNQLRFDDEAEEEPDDIPKFKCVLQNVDIQILKVGFSSTLIQTSSGLRHIGMSDELINQVYNSPDNSVTTVEAGNGKVAHFNLAGDTQDLRQYNSWRDYPDRPSAVWKLGNIKQLVSGHTSFAALGVDGRVWTWGDERYSACLGREVSSHGTSSSAAQPTPIPDLASLPTGPVTKIALGGYVGAALTAGQDLYLWGVDASLRLSVEPAPLDLHGLDVLDVSVGDGHMIVLTVDRRVWVIGEGGNGQLGLGAEVQKTEEWREVDLGLPAGREVVRVVAGPKSSLVLVKISQGPHS